MATSWKGKIRIADILAHQSNWRRYIAWQGGRVRSAVFVNMRKVLLCRTIALGVHLFRCPRCLTVKVVPHSCKSVLCTSCGVARTENWCRDLLSEVLDVKYRHLVFTLPWQLRLVIQDNRDVLIPVLFRALADSILSLTVGTPEPRGRKSRRWRERCRRVPRMTPGFLVVLHTFGSDLKWNVHFHVVITGGGVRLDGKRWVHSPQRYMVPAPLLAMEWKLNVIEGIRAAHRKSPLYCRPLRSDPTRRFDVEKCLGFIRTHHWHIRLGPSLAKADGAVRYACRYSKRPVIAEGRIVKYHHGYVSFLFKDYYKGGAYQCRKLPVLTFIHRLVQHLPQRYVHQVRYYGLFATAVRAKALPQARQLLEQRKRRRLQPLNWESRRKAVGDTKPLSCPQCGTTMKYWSLMFGAAIAMAMILGVKASEPIPPNLYIHARTIHKRSSRICLKT
jgi:Putative transposase/Transposase zinc-binding domain